tara:strand:- start:2891 stop:3505 length:615 start_codon:yes stop_codon:yes gene_type:complete
MTITYPRALPAGISFNASRFKLDFNKSTFDATSRKKSRQSWNEGKTDRWIGVYSTPRLTATQLRLVSSWMRAMIDDNGSFYAIDPDNTNPATVVTGTPLVNGASQTGGSIITDGWAFSVTAMLAGERLQIGTQYYELKEDVVTDGAGNATIEIMPKLRASPANNAVITTANPKMVAKLSGIENTIDTDHMKTGVISFAWEEELD